MKFLIIFLILFIPMSALAADLDSDGDGISDQLEMSRYLTDPNKADTDGDGFADNLELINGYSPVAAGKRLVDIDSDSDGLNDGYELALGAGLKNPDTNGNGVNDGDEFNQSLDPSKAGKVKLEKSIDVDISDQRLQYFLGPVRLGVRIVSTGKASTPTPIGEFKIEKKNKKAWSKMAGLWMPYWMSFNGVYAFHELPEWPNGTKEGANHLGIPVSHGCVRLGIGPAEQLYDWTPVGTKIIIHK